MRGLKRVLAGWIVALALGAGGAGPAGAQELPTGAARVVEKVQTRIVIAQANLGFHIAAILENQPTPGK
jgi:hypothetical protein